LEATVPDPVPFVDVVAVAAPVQGSSSTEKP
jgi:hypothetical protein